MEAITQLSWKGLEDQTFEHCSITRTPGQMVVQSKIEGAVNNEHTIVEYVLELDNAWMVNSVEVKMTQPATRSIKLTHNKYGEWVDSDLHTWPELDGCMELDISLTPFTNTLPIKRLWFKPGESHEIKVVYFDLPAFDIRIQTQRYTYLGDNVFRFESLDTGYTNEITFNASGFVQHYPELFELQSATSIAPL
jgi:hypothetical protein